ncbi:hypothetical protein LRR80_04840 [Streptomyces sp. RO-S4]|uniref:hypothetical protein n=1 Tax=unclassified Streptomyces TaxID=2593676 RepID=UPI00208FBD97|nr:MULTISPECIES: hypothetical protein [unclassified Streptomyces]MCO4698752.1 hypothetical protein [Streptomyces sp. RO-S4]MDU0301510.1 hypothetical protein [Streptomyces sp. PAL114]
MDRRVGWALGVGCYALAVIAGMFVLVDDVGLAVQVALWVVHGALLFLGIRKFGARESSSYAALFIVVVSSLAVGVAGVARDDLTLQRRGETVVATVVGERLDPPEGRKGRNLYYTLEHEDGTRVPGPEMRTTSDLYDVGQMVTVIEDPQADLRPQTPGQADATGEALGAAGFTLAAVASVVWMAWRGFVTERETAEVVGRARLRREQEKNLRAALRAYPADRRGYIKVSPGEYPDLTHGRAARIAWEEGLRAEAVGNHGAWRFSDTVIEEVPHR